MHRILAVVAVAAFVSACGGQESDGDWLETSRRCYGTAVVDGRDLRFRHDRYDTADGSVMLVCSVGDPLVTISNTYVWKSNQVGARDGLCMVGRDLDASTGGFWAFTLSRGEQESLAVYTDKGSVSNGLGVLVPCETF